MIIKEINIEEELALSLNAFKQMDYFAVENYQLPIELMMENAGLQLANLVAHITQDLNATVLIGVGSGNNGGGGLVAARRLAAWGYRVYLDVFTTIEKELPKRQLDRAIKFGVNRESIAKPDIWIDTYLGFSQRLLLSQALEKIVINASQSDAVKISLDIPTGFLGDITSPYFRADKVLSLAASKKILYKLPSKSEVFIADIGIPRQVYKEFGVDIPPFAANNLIRLNRD